ncbi:MAG: hypothetical protein EBS79_02810 [Gammaproteobacteria bacterium]|jgi:hypothetical protein|nr:hypothetical protein [Gammaproteobacteria bacterium]
MSGTSGQPERDIRLQTIRGLKHISNEVVVDYLNTLLKGIPRPSIGLFPAYLPRLVLCFLSTPCTMFPTLDCKAEPPIHDHWRNATDAWLVHLNIDQRDISHP